MPIIDSITVIKVIQSSSIITANEGKGPNGEQTGIRKYMQDSTWFNKHQILHKNAIFFFSLSPL